MKIEFITPTVTNKPTLINNLLLSPDFFRIYPLHVIQNSKHITYDIQSVIDTLLCDVVIVVHDDVRLLEGFEYNLLKSLAKLPDDWAVAGVAGANNNGVIAHIADRQTILGSRIDTPIEVDTIDEVLVAINMKQELRIDSGILTHHLWATDLCLQAKSQGLKNYIIEAMVHHNSTNNYQLGDDYYKQVNYIHSKWRHVLPFNTTCHYFKEDV